MLQKIIEAWTEELSAIQRHNPIWYACITINEPNNEPEAIAKKYGATLPSDTPRLFWGFREVCEKLGIPGTNVGLKDYLRRET